MASYMLDYEVILIMVDWIRFEVRLGMTRYVGLGLRRIEVKYGRLGLVRVFGVS